MAPAQASQRAAYHPSPIMRLPLEKGDKSARGRDGGGGRLCLIADNTSRLQKTRERERERKKIRRCVPVHLLRPLNPQVV